MHLLKVILCHSRYPTREYYPFHLDVFHIFQDYVDLVDEWAVADPGFLNYFGGKSLATQSHGQSLMSYFTNRYKIRGLYFLDEPETALSPKTQIRLLKVLSDMSSAGHAQFIIATHSPILMSCPGAAIFSFDFSPLKKMEFRQTDHYRIYRDFMKNLEGHHSSDTFDPTGSKDHEEKKP